MVKSADGRFVSLVPRDECDWHLRNVLFCQTRYSSREIVVTV